jgi:hypothetical protein
VIYTENKPSTEYWVNMGWKIKMQLKANHAVLTSLIVKEMTLPNPRFPTVTDLMSLRGIINTPMYVIQELLFVCQQ